MFKYNKYLSHNNMVPPYGDLLSYHTRYQLRFEPMNYQFDVMGWLMDGASGQLIHLWTEWKDV